jgi:ADP-ribosyl-[dinitrogen reductase] hydrolase
MTALQTQRQMQIIGALLGGAIGDVLGGVTERSGLAISDDTQLTLATCEAIVDAKGVDPERIAASFLKWYRAGAITGIGSSTLKALRDLDGGGHWALCGARGERAAGNGAAMRIAPLAFVLDPLAAENRVVYRDVCRITHHHDEAYLGAMAVAMTLNAMASNLPESTPLPGWDRLIVSLPDCQIRDRLVEVRDASCDMTLAEAADRFGASGFVVETVPLALLAAARMVSQSMESVIAELVQIDGDIDTIASIAGQIAGARLGVGGLPASAVELPCVQATLPTFERFADAAVRLR